MDRPKCNRCGGPLDFFFDPETGRTEWYCNNPQPIRDDVTHQRAWDKLPGDEVVHLEVTAGVTP